MDRMPYWSMVEILVTLMYTNEHVSQDSHPAGGSVGSNVASRENAMGIRYLSCTPMFFSRTMNFLDKCGFISPDSVKTIVFQKFRPFSCESGR